MILIRYWSLSTSLEGSDVFLTFVNETNFHLSDRFVQNGQVLEDILYNGKNNLNLTYSYRDENKTEFTFIRNLNTNDSRDVEIIETMYYFLHFASSNETWNETTPLNYLSNGEQVLKFYKFTLVNFLCHR